MTVQLPSKRLLIATGALAAAGTVAALVAVYWQTIALWAMLAAVFRLAWRMLVGPSRRHGSLIRRVAEAAAVVAGVLGLRKAAHVGAAVHERRAEAEQLREARAAEWHAARLETERARADELRSRRRQRIEQARSSRAAVAERERAAYWRGAADAGR